MHSKTDLSMLYNDIHYYYYLSIDHIDPIDPVDP